MSKDPEESPDVTVLFAAAGVGQRLGGKKQFRRLGGVSLLAQTMRAFDVHPDVDRLIVISPPEDVTSVRRDLEECPLAKPWVVVPGGATRQQSVRCGLDEVPDTSDIALIHDAVRPFVTSREIAEVVARTGEHGAASLAIPVVDTLRRVDGQVFGSTVEREGLLRMQTPQGFVRAVIIAAHQMAAATGRIATDYVELAQMAGHDVYIVEGSTANFKITTPDDWYSAELLWNRWVEENRT